LIIVIFREWFNKAWHEIVFYKVLDRVIEEMMDLSSVLLKQIISVRIRIAHL